MCRWAVRLRSVSPADDLNLRHFQVCSRPNLLCEGPPRLSSILSTWSGALPHCVLASHFLYGPFCGLHFPSLIARCLEKSTTRASRAAGVLFSLLGEPCLVLGQQPLAWLRLWTECGGGRTQARLCCLCWRSLQCTQMQKHPDGCCFWTWAENSHFDETGSLRNFTPRCASC